MSPSPLFPELARSLLYAAACVSFLPTTAALFPPLLLSPPHSLSRSKILRYDPANKEWKERGLGAVRILLNKETNVRRVICRRDKTFKVCVNFAVVPTVIIAPHASSDKAYIVTCNDFSDNELKVSTFAFRFGSPEKAESFRTALEAAITVAKETAPAEVATPEAAAEAAEPAAEPEAEAEKADEE
jgi:Ran-binding protein 1